MRTDALGDRMKKHEAVETQRRFIPGFPIYARIDGRSFSKFTKNMQRPYDVKMSNAMVDTTKELVSATHATIGYVQSDEISLAWIPTNEHNSWFEGKISKMTSVLAGLASSAFCRSLIKNFGIDEGINLITSVPHFDARVISLPSETECANMFLWRNLDCAKNAISMAASHYYSHKELHGKTGAEKQEMLWQKNINFNDYPYFFKRGTWVKRVARERQLTFEELSRIPEAHRPAADQLLVRTELLAYDMPPLNRVVNRNEALFRHEEPISNHGEL